MLFTLVFWENTRLSWIQIKQNSICYIRGLITRGFQGIHIFVDLRILFPKALKGFECSILGNYALSFKIQLWRWLWFSRIHDTEQIWCALNSHFSEAIKALKLLLSMSIVSWFLRMYCRQIGSFCSVNVTSIFCC